MENKINLKTVVLTTGAALSTMIGAGTCSGQEILQYLVSFGYAGLGAIAIAIVINVWFASGLMSVGRTLNCETSKEAYQYFLGKPLGLVIDYFTYAMLFLFFVVMLSGAGATITQYLGTGEMVSKVVFTIIVLVSALLGFEKVLKILGALGPVILVLSIVIGLISLLQNLDGLAHVNEVLEQHPIAHPSGLNTWWLSGIFYIAFAIVSAVPIFVKLGANTDNKKTAFVSGVGYGLAYMCVAAIFYLAMLASVGKVYDKAIPTLELASQISPVLALVFTVLILLAIYSTALSFCFSVADRVSKGNKKIYYGTIVVLCVLGFFGALFPFATIINTVYPFIGAVGIVVSIGMIYRLHINKGDLSKYGTPDESAK